MADREIGFTQAGAPLAHATPAAALAVSANDDDFYVAYEDARQNRYWYANVSGGTAICVNIHPYPGLEGRQVMFGYDADDWYVMSGNLSTSIVQVVIEDICIFAISGNVAGNIAIRWNDTTGGGQGVRVTSCVIGNWNSGVQISAGDNNVCQVDNTLLWFCINGYYTATSPALGYFITAIGCRIGLRANNLASTFTSCVATGDLADFLTIAAAATVTFCASHDDTADDAGGAGNIINQNPADFDWWHDNDNDHHERSFCVLDTSSLAGAGAPVVGLPNDAFGNVRDAVNPSIGWHEATPTPFEVTHPTAAQTELGVGFQNWVAAVVGTFECGAGAPPYCCGAIDAAPAAQGCILVRFCEMDCAPLTVPYRYDFHVKHVDLGPLTPAEINAGTWYARSCYNDEVNFAPGSPEIGSPGPNAAILQALIAFEAWNQHGDNIHLFTNREYQIAVRAVAIDATDMIYEDDNHEVVISWSSGYQGIQWEHILSWPCTYFCDGEQLDVGNFPAGIGINSLPKIEVDELDVRRMPNVPVSITAGINFRDSFADLGTKIDRFLEAMQSQRRQ